MRFTLRRIRLNSQGYTANGTYYGNGAPLYWYASDDGRHDDHIRAHNRDDAKTRICANHPDATFYR